MINETFARQIYPGDNPIGRKFILNLGNEQAARDHRRRRRREAGDARRRDSADGVSVVAPVRVRHDELRGAHRPAIRPASAPAAVRVDPRDRSAAAGVGGAAARRGVRGIDRAAAADGGGDEHLRRRGAAARGARRLRHRRVFGVATRRASSAFASRSARSPGQIIGMVVGQNLRIVALGLVARAAGGDSGDAAAARIAVPGRPERSDRRSSRSA